MCSRAESIIILKFRNAENTRVVHVNISGSGKILDFRVIKTYLQLEITKFIEKCVLLLSPMSENDLMGWVSSWVDSYLSN